MVLIKSISGIRGTIGGNAGDGLNPVDISRFTAGYGMWIKRKYSGKKNEGKKPEVVVGRDARISGKMVNKIVTGTLIGLGIDVLDIGLAATPTVEIAVTEEKAEGGIIITASHNPENWNALKLLNRDGEFLSDKEGREIISIAEKEEFSFSSIEKLGILNEDFSYGDKHIKKVINLSQVNIQAIQSAEFKVVIDGINSVGGLIIPALLRSLGVKDIVELSCDPTGKFSHNPEPLPENIIELSRTVTKNNADLGFVVDPDVDRLAIVSEDGTMFGEEYTLVAVADYILQHNKGNTVSNLSSTRALMDVTEFYGGKYFSSAVGEVNVVALMKEKNAVIGGEGNGGVIFPELHYGRDALVGIALFLSHLALSGKKCSELRSSYPGYYISKNKLELSPDIDTDLVIRRIKEFYTSYKLDERDGLKIEFNKEWVLLRKSNTEPVIRIYAESTNMEKANKLAKKVIEEIKKISRK